MIKFVGLLEEKEISNYQKSEISSLKRVLKEPKDIMTASIPYQIIIGIVMFMVMFYKVYTNKGLVGISFFSGIIIGLILGFIGLFIHELLHAIVYPRNAKVSIGIVKKLPPVFVCLASYPLKRSRFILMSLIPYVLGIIPLVIFLILRV